MDIEKDFNATVIQSLARRYIVRKTILQTLNERYEKIYDPKRKKCFYYDTRFDTSSWEKYVVQNAPLMSKQIILQLFITLDPDCF